MKKRIFGGLVVLMVLLSMQFIAAENATEEVGLNETIEKQLSVKIITNKEEYSPGDRISVSGIVEREGVKLGSGVARIKIEDEYSINILNGGFYFESVLRDRIRSGKHKVKVVVEDGLENSGEVESEIYVKAIPSKLEIYLNNNSFLPKDTISISAILKDQNSEGIESEVVLTIYDSRGAVMEKVEVVGGDLEYNLPVDALPGEWWVYAYSKNLKARRFFKIEENPKIEFDIEGDLLRVVNVGNVPFRESLLFNLLGKDKVSTETKEVSLGVGKDIFLELSAPRGEYIVEVEGKEFKDDFFGVELTGGVIGIKEKQSGLSKVIAIGVILVTSGLAVFLRAKKSKETEEKKRKND